MALQRQRAARQPFQRVRDGLRPPLGAEDIGVPRHFADFTGIESSRNTAMDRAEERSVQPSCPKRLFKLRCRPDAGLIACQWNRLDLPGPVVTFSRMRRDPSSRMSSLVERRWPERLAAFLSDALGGKNAPAALSRHYGLDGEVALRKAVSAWRRRSDLACEDGHAGPVEKGAMAGALGPATAGPKAQPGASGDR